MKHTPGPWKWRPIGLLPEEMATVDPVILSHNHTPYVSHADARLIACAPELLAFMKKWQPYNIEADEEEQDDYDAELAVLIAKAEGRDT